MGQSINNFFERIYCINLDRRTDRWDMFVRESNLWGIKDVIRCSAVDGNSLPETYNRGRKFPKSAVGLVMTNIGILEDCLKDGVNSVLILEDDIVFTNRMNSLEETIKDLPEDWDSIYLGGNHNSHKGVNPPKQIADGLCKIHHTFTTHAVGFRGPFIESVLDKIKKLDSPLDVAYTDLQKSHNFYCFYPAVAVQRAGYSDIQNQTMDYSNWIK